MIKFSPLGTNPEYEKIWFMERNPICVVNDAKGLVAWDVEIDCIVAMVVLDTWAENSCQIHIAIDNPMVLRHGFKEEVFDYIFKTCGRGIVFGLTPADNLKALKFNSHIGLVEIYRLKDAHKVGVDLVLQEIRKEDYYGQAVRSRAA